MTPGGVSTYNIILYMSHIILPFMVPYPVIYMSVYIHTMYLAYTCSISPRCYRCIGLHCTSTRTPTHVLYHSSLSSQTASTYHITTCDIGDCTAYHHGRQRGWLQLSQRACYGGDAYRQRYRPHDSLRAYPKHG